VGQGDELSCEVRLWRWRYGDGLVVIERYLAVNSSYVINYILYSLYSILYTITIPSKLLSYSLLPALLIYFDSHPPPESTALSASTLIFSSSPLLCLSLCDLLHYPLCNPRQDRLLLADPLGYQHRGLDILSPLRLSLFHLSLSNDVKAASHLQCWHHIMRHRKRFKDDS
jgi:hypothetical protein